MSQPSSEGRIIGPNPQYQAIVAKIISILRGAHKPEPITEGTTIGDKANVILPDVNSAFFPPGQGKFTAIATDVSVAGLADQVINKGGEI